MGGSKNCILHVLTSHFKKHCHWVVFCYCANQKSENTWIFLYQKLVYFFPVFILLLISESFFAKAKCKFESKLNKSVHEFYLYVVSVPRTFDDNSKLVVASFRNQF